MEKSTSQRMSSRMIAALAMVIRGSAGRINMNIRTHLLPTQNEVGDPGASHNRRSKNRVAMDKRAATKARNVKRHKKACR